MNKRLIALLIRNKELSLVSKAIMIFLITVCNEYGCVELSQEKIAEYIHIGSTTTIKTGLKELKKIGYITIQRQSRKPNRIIVNIEKIGGTKND